MHQELPASPCHWPRVSSTKANLGDGQSEETRQGAAPPFPWWTGCISLCCVCMHPQVWAETRNYSPYNLLFYCPEMAVLCSPMLEGYKDNHAWHFLCGYWELKRRSLCLQSKYSYPLSHLTTPIYFHFIKSLTSPLSAFITLLSQLCEILRKTVKGRNILFWLMISEVSSKVTWSLCFGPCWCRASQWRAGRWGKRCSHQDGKKQRKHGEGERGKRPGTSYVFPGLILVSTVFI